MAQEQTIDGRKVLEIMQKNEIQVIEVQLKADHLYGSVRLMREVEMVMHLKFNGINYQASKRIRLDRPDDFASIFDEAIAVIKHTLIETLRKEAQRL